MALNDKDKIGIDLFRKTRELRRLFEADELRLKMNWLNDNNLNKLETILKDEETGEKFFADKVFISVMSPCYGGYVSIRYVGPRISSIDGKHLKSRGARSLPEIPFIDNI